MTKTKQEIHDFLEDLDDDDLLREVERRDIMPEPEYGCDCDPEDYEYRIDHNQRYAMNKAIDLLREKNLLSDALLLTDIMESIT